MTPVKVQNGRRLCSKDDEKTRLARVTSSLFASSFIYKHLFRGKGLGKDEDGRVRPVQVDQKQNVKGIGYGTEGAFEPWWDDLYTKTAIKTKIKSKRKKEKKKSKVSKELKVSKESKKKSEQTKKDKKKRKSKDSK